MQTVRILTAICGASLMFGAACAHKKTPQPPTKASPAASPVRPQATAAASQPASTQPAPAGATNGIAAPTGTPAAAAATDKEQRLSKLLELYKADKITPREYHQQRAKILAEP